MRAVARIVDCSLNTVSKLLVDAGRASMSIHDQFVHDVSCSRVECDEVWAFCYSKARNVGMAVAAPPEAGDLWMWTALDAESKLLISWHLSLSRDVEPATVFTKDLAGRLANRVQLTTDGLQSYVDAVEEAFGAEVDYGQLVKTFGGRTYSRLPFREQHKYSPGPVASSAKTIIMGRPDKKYISTSLVERLNMTVRMSMRRYTRLTNGFSKKYSRHWAMAALFWTWYNFCRRHGTVGQTPAQNAGLVNQRYDAEWILDRADYLSASLRKGGWHNGQIGL